MKKEIAKQLFTIFCLVLILALVAQVASFADTIKLKDGREIQGYLKRITDKQVTLAVLVGNSYGTIWFDREKVVSINGLSVEEAEARLSTQKAFITLDKDKAVSSSANEGLNFIAKTRKLDFKTTPKIEVVSKERLKELLQKGIEKNYTPEKLLTRGKLLLKLGLISKAEEYSQKVTELLAEQVAGFYDPDDKKIYVTERSMGMFIPGLPSITIMHEQVHALQDQYHDLKKIMDLILNENEDKGLAQQSVVEGEATVLMYDAFLRSMKSLMTEGRESKKAASFDMRSFVIDSMLAFSKHVKTEEGKPAVFVEDLLFPYVWGGTFVQHLVNTKGWESVDGIYQDMPVSSEQVMHPEKYYIARDNPKEVKVPDLSTILGEPWKQLSRDTSGEFGFYLIGKTFLDELSTKMMSEGWGGDTFELYEEATTKQTLFISLSQWDTQRDADEFFDFYKKIIEKKYPQLTSVKQESNFSEWKSGQENIYISKSQDLVTIIEGASDNTFARLKESLSKPNATAGPKS